MTCRVMQQQILDANGFAGQKAWAFGLGLERLAMVLFSIPDIRLFWSSDKRFTKQFRAGNLAAKFKPYSKFPPCFKVGRPLAFHCSHCFPSNLPPRCSAFGCRYLAQKVMFLFK